MFFNLKMKISAVVCQQLDWNALIQYKVIKYKEMLLLLMKVIMMQKSQGQHKRLGVALWHVVIKTEYTSKLAEFFKFRSVLF